MDHLEVRNREGFEKKKEAEPLTQDDRASLAEFGI
jgi:hypothetical protein